MTPERAFAAELLEVDRKVRELQALTEATTVDHLAIKKVTEAAHKLGVLDGKMQAEMASPLRQGFPNERTQKLRSELTKARKDQLALRRLRKAHGRLERSYGEAQTKLAAATKELGLLRASQGKDAIIRQLDYSAHPQATINLIAEVRDAVDRWMSGRAPDWPVLGPIAKALHNLDLRLAVVEARKGFTSRT